MHLPEIKFKPESHFTKREQDLANDNFRFARLYGEIMVEYSRLVFEVEHYHNKEIEKVKKLNEDNKALRTALYDAIERMDRARGLLQEEGGSWAMLDTKELNNVIQNSK